MRTEVIYPEGELERTVWSFWYSESLGGVVLDFVSVQKRPSKRHKFRVTKKWNRLDKRDNNMDRPSIPPAVSGPALEQMRSLVVWKGDELW